MLIVTTPIIEGVKIKEYKGPVFNQVVAGFDVLMSLSAGWRNLVGGRSESHESQVEMARNEAISGIIERARNMGANAIIGLTVDYEMISGTQSSNAMLMTKVFGTAVVV